MKTGIELIKQERREQLETHHRTIKSDVKWNTNKQLRDGAVALIKDNPILADLPNEWQCYPMNHAITKSYKERLIIAGALIAAEIDRLQAIDNQKQ